MRMKTRPQQLKARCIRGDRILCTLVSLLILANTTKLVAQGGDSVTTKPIDEQIVTAITTSKSDKPYIFDGLFGKDYEHRRSITSRLIQIFNDPGSPGYAKGYSAYYLGRLHASEAVDSLAAQIGLSVPSIGSDLEHQESPEKGLPAANALTEIGAPAIPRMIRNLTENDDSKIRELSLRVLYRIEGDKDVVQLRLQKVLKAEHDPNKQARLQSALKALAETKF